VIERPSGLGFSRREAQRVSHSKKRGFAARSVERNLFQPSQIQAGDAPIDARSVSHLTTSASGNAARLDIPSFTESPFFHSCRVAAAELDDIERILNITEGEAHPQPGESGAAAQHEHHRHDFSPRREFESQSVMPALPVICTPRTPRAITRPAGSGRNRGRHRPAARTTASDGSRTASQNVPGANGDSRATNPKRDGNAAGW